MSLGDKLVKVMETVRYMEQDDENKYQGYKYTKAARQYPKSRRF